MTIISHASFFDFIVNAVDNPETPPPTMIVSFTPKEFSSEGEEEDEDARTTKLLPLLPLLERAARTLLLPLVDKDDTLLVLLFLFPIEEDIPVVLVVIMLLLLYEYLLPASISLREDDVGISALAFSVSLRFEAKRERERGLTRDAEKRERTNASKIDFMRRVRYLFPKESLRE